MAIMLSVLAVLLLLLLLPVTLHVTLFDGELQATVRYLFLRYRFPSEKEAKPKADKPHERRKKKKKQEAAPEKKEKEPEEKKWDFAAIQSAIELGKELLVGAGRAVKTLLRGVKVRQLKLEIAAVGENAADTGIKSGNYNAYLHTAAALLQNFVRVRELYLNVYPAFWLGEETIAFEGKLSLRPVRALMAAGVLIVEAAPALFRYLRRGSAKGEAQPPQEKEAPAAAGDK